MQQRQAQQHHKLNYLKQHLQNNYNKIITTTQKTKGLISYLAVVELILCKMLVCWSCLENLHSNSEN